MKIFTQNDLYHPPTKLETSFRARLKVNSAIAEQYIPQIWSDKFSATIKKRHFNNKTLGEKVLEQMKKLKAQGLSNEKIKALFTKIKEEVPNYKCFNDILDNLTKALPKKKNSLFAYQRMQVAFYNHRFNIDAFNLFNTAYKKYSNNKDFDMGIFSECICNCSDYQNNRMIEQRKKYLLNNSSKASLADTKDLFQNIHPVALRYIETLQKKGRKIDYKIFKDYFIDSDPTCFGAFFELCKKYPKQDTEFLASLAKDCVDKEKVFSQSLFAEAYENLEKEYFLELFKNCRTEDGKSINPYNAFVYYNLRLNGWEENEINPKIFFDTPTTTEELFEKAKIFTSIVLHTAKNNPDIDKDIIETICQFAEYDQNENAIQIFLDLIRKGFENKLSIGRNYCDIDNREIMNLLALNTIATMRTYNIIGDKIFTNILKTKNYNEICDLISIFGNIDNDKEFIAPEILLKAINPKNSFEYTTNNSIISLEKEKLQTADSEARQSIIKKINDYTYQNNLLLKNSIKDPQEALEIAFLYKTLYDKDPKLAEKLNPFLKNKTLEEKEEFYKVLNNHLLDIICTNDKFSTSIHKKFDLSKSKYLPHIIYSKAEFRKNLTLLLHDIDKYPDISIEEALNQLECNKITNKQFKSLNLNYTNWTHFNPNMKIQFKTKIDLDLAKHNVLKNFENDLNDDLLNDLPIGERHRLFKIIQEAGYTFNAKEEPIYDNDGYLENIKYRISVLKNNMPIDTEDLKIILNKIKEEMTNNPFWTKSENIEGCIVDSREHLKEQLLVQRYNELKPILNKKNVNKDYNITIQSVDMNNIAKALFLGDEAGCCTASNGINGWSAANYIRSKAIGAIEIKDEETPIGNTMIFLANINDKISLILDNVELKSEYQYNENIKDGIIEYAKKIGEYIGKPDIKIYAGPNRHKVDFSQYPLDDYEPTFIGNIDKPIYVDSLSDEIENFDYPLYCTLHKIS